MRERQRLLDRASGVGPELDQREARGDERGGDPARARTPRAEHERGEWWSDDHAGEVAELAGDCTRKQAGALERMIVEQE